MQCLASCLLAVSADFDGQTDMPGIDRHNLLPRHVCKGLLARAIMPNSDTQSRQCGKIVNRHTVTHTGLATHTWTGRSNGEQITSQMWQTTNVIKCGRQQM